MVYDILGWLGMVLVLVAYLLLSTNKIDNGTLYQILNLLAAVCMAVGLFPTKAWFSFSLQIIWAIIAIFSILKITYKKSK